MGKSVLADRTYPLAIDDGRPDVIVYEHLDGTLTISYGPYTVGYYTPDGRPMAPVPTRRSTREEHRLPFRRKRSALRAALGSTPADAPLSVEQ